MVTPQLFFQVEFILFVSLLKSFPFSSSRHLNDIDLGAASFWIRVALGATVAAVVGVTLYKAVAKNK